VARIAWREQATGHARHRAVSLHHGVQLGDPWKNSVRLRTEMRAVTVDRGRTCATRGNGSSLDWLRPGVSFGAIGRQERSMLGNGRP